MKIQLQIRTEKEVVDKIRKLAAKDNRTLSSYIHNLLKLHIESAEKEGKL
ncbi:hypothetical protein KAR91_25650 [Candidatus Pacearchaeota archaeon]|nr:hypothetical protein [Candidatus Pacearchaeota archaeon]